MINKISDRDLEMFALLSQFLLFAFSLGGAHATIIATFAVHPIFLIPTGITFLGFSVFSLRLMDSLRSELERRQV